MKRSWRPLTQNTVSLASGVIPARLCGIAALLLIARRGGVVMVGVYALAQSMMYYTYPFIDFGMRHVGARLIARYPEAGREIVGRVQRRRLLMSSLILPFLLAYAALANLPTKYKVFIFFFSAISCLYAVSLDWVSWGKEQFRLFGFAHMIVPGSILLFLLLGDSSDRLLWRLVAGSILGYGVQFIIFWRWWRVHRRAATGADTASLADVRESLTWRRTSIMGLAWFCNQAFTNIDMLMLGVMSNPHEVGLYSAAYRTMNQVLFTYYLLTSILYPRLARQSMQQRLRSLRPEILLSLAAAGAVIALLLAVSRRAVLATVFGKEFLPATLLLSVLAWAIPLDFLTSYLSNAYIAWNMERKVLACTAIGAGSNVILNLIYIPVYGAKAAAVNTLISYVVYLAGLALAGWYASELGRARRPLAAAHTRVGGMQE